MPAGAPAWAVEQAWAVDLSALGGRTVAAAQRAPEVATKSNGIQIARGMYSITPSLMGDPTEC